MQTPAPPSPAEAFPRARLPIAAAAICGAAYVVLAVVLALTPPVEGDLEAIDYVSDAAFVIALLTGAPALVVLGSGVGARRPAIVAAGGQLVLAAGVLAGMAVGHATSWFAVFGVSGNAAALVGTAIIAVRGRRGGALPLGSAVLLGLSVPIGVGLAGIGGSIVPGAFWLVTAFRAGARGARP